MVILYREHHVHAKPNKSTRVQTLWVVPGIGKWSVMVDYKISNGPPSDLRRQRMPRRAGMDTAGIN